jgi:hypothetical protein
MNRIYCPYFIEFTILTQTGTGEEKLEIIFSNLDIITSINTEFYQELLPCLSAEEIDLMQLALIFINSTPLMKYFKLI